MENLKPCPFCGGKGKVMNRSGMYLSSFVFCVECGSQSREFKVSTSYSSDEKAIEAWNRRANDEAD